MLAERDRQIVRDTIVRAKLKLTLPEERVFRRPLPPTTEQRTEPSAGGTARSSESASTHCTFYGHRISVTAIACGFHADLLELDAGNE